jgi:hypothetical protein
MSATNPKRIRDLIHKYGWDAMVRLSALGIQNLAEAQVLFVDSGDTNALDADDTEHGLSIDKPLATIDYAVGLCTASEQSVILVAPGHAETEASAEALVTCDVAGVKIIGIGDGTLRPTITLSTDTGAVAFSVTAANVVISNFKIVVSIDAAVSAISVAASNCKLLDVEVADNADSTEAAIGILTTAAADNLTIERYIHNGFLAGDACTEAISLIGVDRCVIKDSWFRGAFSTAAVNMTTTACSGVIVKGCVFENGTTALSADVVDGASSKWSAVNCWDVVGSYGFSGGSAAALAADDVSSVATAVAAVSTTGVSSAPTASTLADTLHKDGSFTYDNTTDSLEAIRDRLDQLRSAVAQSLGLPIVGSVFWVDPVGGDDGNTGLEPTAAFATLQAAIDACTDDAHDVIVRMPGKESLTAAITFDKQGITVVSSSFAQNANQTEVGAYMYPDDTYTTGPAAIVTKPCTLIGLEIIGRNTSHTKGDTCALNGSCLSFAGEGGGYTGGFCHIKNCRFVDWFGIPYGIVISGAGYITIEGCYFEHFDSGILFESSTSGLPGANQVKGCIFDNCATGIEHGVSPVGSTVPLQTVYKENVFMNYTDAIDFNQGSSGVCDVLVAGNYFETATDGSTYDCTVDQANAIGALFSGNHYAE